MDKTVKTGQRLSPMEIGAVPFAARLSTKLLVLTVIFVALAEILIFVPSITDMRLSWLHDRLNTAAAASIIVDGLPNVELPRPLQDDALMATGTKAIALHKADITRMIVVSEVPPSVNAQYDLSHRDFLADVRDAFSTLLFGGDEVFSVRGPVGDSGMVIELVMSDRALRKAMIVYTQEILLFTVIISFITASMIFLAINRTLIRPIARMTASMQAFADDPSNPAAIVQPPKGTDELALAARHLAAMQGDLQRTLRQQKNLADLGLAVSKINHDMRNILASAQLMSDRLRLVKDPGVQAFAPKLLRALDRAVSYTQAVLDYGRAQEPPPQRRKLRLRLLVDEVHELLGIEPGGVEFVNAVDPGFEIDADPEQLFRVLTNLCRNAIQAMAGEAGDTVVRRLTVSAERSGSVSRILVADTGPGLPRKARDNLFAAFRGSARSGGTGLGLAIAQELARAHGGGLELVESKGGSTIFAVNIPDEPVRLHNLRGALRRPA